MELSLSKENKNKNKNKEEKEITMRTKIRGEEYSFGCRGDLLLVVDGNNVRAFLSNLSNAKFFFIAFLT